MYDNCSSCGEFLLDGGSYFSYPSSAPHITDEDANLFCCSDSQRDFRPLCCACQNYAKCDVCHKDICIFCVRESAQYKCCGLKLCGAGCRTAHKTTIRCIGAPALTTEGAVVAAAPDLVSLSSDEEMMDQGSAVSCEKKHVMTHLPCGPNHLGCNFYPGKCRGCEEMTRDSSESVKRQRDIARLMAIVDTIESETIRTTIQEIVGDPENIKRKHNDEERIIELDQSLKRARHTSNHEEEVVDNCKWHFAMP